MKVDVRRIQKWLRRPMDHRPPPETHASEPVITSLDQVDLGGEVGRDFEANFLLANFRLGPGLHEFSPDVCHRAPLLRRHVLCGDGKSQSLFNLARQTFCDHNVGLLYRYTKDLAIRIGAFG